MKSSVIKNSAKTLAMNNKKVIMVTITMMIILGLKRKTHIKDHSNFVVGTLQEEHMFE